MKKYLYLLLLVNLLFIQNLFSTERPKNIILGHEDKNAYPWVIPYENGYVGIDLDFIALLEKELEIKISTAGYPWTRCLKEMESGRIDGAFASSYKKDREVYGKYPTKGDVPDEEKRIHISGYSLYAMKDSGVNYDGKNLTNLKGPVGVQLGFSIVGEISKMGHAIDDGTNDPEANLMKLMKNRVGAVVLQTQRADNIIEENIDMKSKIIKIETKEAPFGDKPYYIMLSKNIVTKYPEFAGEFWNACEKVRNSKEYKQKTDDFYKKYK